MLANVIQMKSEHLIHMKAKSEHSKSKIEDNKKSECLKPKIKKVKAKSEHLKSKIKKAKTKSERLKPKIEESKGEV